MRLVRTLVMAVLAFLVFGCATQRFHLDNDRGRSQPTYEADQQFFLSGVGQVQEIYVKEVCGSRGIRRVEVVQEPLDVVLAVLTIGIYTPRTARVYCK